MSLTISIPDSIANAVEDLAARSGASVEQLILDALGAYFPPIPVELQDEFEALERASDEDFSRFESMELETTDEPR